MNLTVGMVKFVCGGERGRRQEHLIHEPIVNVMSLWVSPGSLE